MADLATVIQVLVGSGAGAGLVAIGRFIEGRSKRADDKTDETIAALREQVGASNAAAAHERAERIRQREEDRGSLQRLGAKYDALAKQHEEALTVAAGVTYRIRQDSQVPNEFADDMPTEVRDRADLLEAKSAKSLPPAPTRAPQRVIEVDARSPHVRPTDPAPRGYPPGKPPGRP